ncbi:unnamed protein product [Bursaphelenchus okinawaensis]|uniref:E3 ubiquitin-protein ligase PPP1R11 n=1 Tax=Bursaphelenchus okinawaensis TaxID=465554 RepID=A0A811LQ98_9BILA|nr:unnamed protein product [Bursaphelenchus okinawaensis]CAG9126390.1 unnamed protein product [Bursaphelenchus okinawaensis]
MSVTLTETGERRAQAQGTLPILRLQGTTNVERPHVTWSADTVDNENMGRLKSNCCCVYVKPRIWDDPSTWEQDENETEHCRGHTLPPKDKN